jgi:hypothetical protein
MSMMLLLAALAQSPTPLARTRLEPSETVTVGQPISVVVEVLVPSYFMGAPVFPDIDVRNALVVFEPRGTNFTERIGSTTFAAQSRRYNIYPQREGTYEIAEIDVRVRYFDGGPTDASVSPPVVRFRATIPAGAEGLDPFIATTRLTLEERFDHKPAEIRVGDAFTRTVTVTVTDALAMVIPPLEIEPIPGLAIYPEPPSVSDAGGERGAAIVGTRIDSATYVAQETGQYLLPEVAIEWWDVRNARRVRAAAPAIEFEVLAAETTEAGIALPPEEVEDETEADTSVSRVSVLTLARRYGPRVGLALALGWLFVHLVRRVTPSLEKARYEHEHSESAYFARFRDAALSGEPRAAASALMAWLDRRNEGTRTALFRDFAEAAGDPKLDREAERLDGILYGDGRDRSEWTGGGLYRRVAKARTKRADADSRDDELPPLNP